MPLSLIQAVRDRFPAGRQGSHAYRGDATVVVCRESSARCCADTQGGSGLPDELPDGPHGRGLLRLRDEAVAGLLCLLWRCGESVAGDSRHTDPWPDLLRHARFIVVYHFFSLPLKHRLRLEVPVEEDDRGSRFVTSLWAALTGSSGKSGTCSGSASGDIRT